jgi:hypothetical protein
MKTLAACVAVLLLSGCIQRRIVVTSEPSGAVVWLNDTEIGRTPTQSSFRYYGTYDVRLEMPGYEAVHTSRRTRAPFHEYPGPDLVATVIPHRFETVIEWHFDLVPVAEHVSSEEDFERDLIDRARALQEQSQGENDQD